jgi:gliding motility-associated-like protein
MRIEFIVKGIFLLYLCTLSKVCRSQTDRNFWFAAPEVTNEYDQDILLRISAFNQPATIRLSQPANPGFTPIALTIPSNTTQTINLTTYIEIVENKPANQILNYGLFLESNVDVTAYYEVNRTINPDIFSLKGDNAKGNLFFTPFQTTYSTGGYPGPPSAAFIIVATEDNTTVTITPRTAIVGHPASVPFTIVLNRGQTYAGASLGTSGSNRPAGSKISSDKPICVTIKDDLVQNGSCADLSGDQLVPVHIIGSEYVVIRGALQNVERAFILATEDGTDIFLDGSTTAVATLNTGEQYIGLLNQGNPSLYINSSKPVYVLHYAGFGCEMGAALLPPIECTGSEQVFFTRSTSEYFGLTIICKTGNEGAFSLNGSGSLVPASAFNPVAGSSGNRMAAQISFSTNDVGVGATSVLSSSIPGALFHLGIINGGSSSGCRYGYFSDYNSLNLGGSSIFCSNDTLTLDAGANKESFLWNTGDTTQSIKVNEGGTYWVTATRGGCIFNDTITVTKEDPKVVLGNDTAICGNTTLQLHAGSNFSQYSWQDNSTDSTFSVTESGSYSVTATTFTGCFAKDTINVLITLITQLAEILVLSPLCEGQELRLLASGQNNATFQWFGPNQLNSTDTSVTITSANTAINGEYQLIQTVDNCKDTTSLTLTINPLPEVEVAGDSIICSGASTILSAGNGFVAYNWSTQESSQTISVGAGTYSVTVTDTNGCISATQVIEVSPAGLNAGISVAPDLVALKGNPFQFSDASTSTSPSETLNYFWDFEDSNTSIERNPNHTYADTGTYTVILLVTTAEGCLDTAYQTVKVVEGIVIPNAFSPDGDGINEFFEMGLLQYYKSPELTVFNRWGRNVFESENYQNDWNAANVTAGTYFYILKLVEINQVFKGTVLIVK